jgi:hypothetical protein
MADNPIDPNGLDVTTSASSITTIPASTIQSLAKGTVNVEFNGLYTNTSSGAYLKSFGFGGLLGVSNETSMSQSFIIDNTETINTTDENKIKM